MLMPTHKLTPAIINAAILGFEQQKLRIDVQMAELRAMLPGGGTNQPMCRNCQKETTKDECRRPEAHE